MGNSGKAGGGGIIWDQNGKWVTGFLRSIGITTNVEVALWALRDGLKLCIVKNIQAIEVELDAKVVVG